MTDTPFVTTQWLADRLNDPNIIVIDGSWHMPAANRNARAEFEAGHLPGAVYFDIDTVADTSSGLPHMLPSPEDFSRMVGDLGIGSDKTLVIYDQSGLFSAPRVWWTFTTMGAKDVKILEGGSPKWKAENRPLETGPSTRNPASFIPRFDTGLVRAYADVLAIVENGGATIIDARPAARFSGEQAEPRAGLASGHMPGALNVPVSELSTDGVLKSAGDLKAIFDKAGVELSQPIVTSCGSGVTASTLALALFIAGASNVAVYDGSWTEWGSKPGAPVEK